MTFEYKSSEALLHLFLDALPPEAKTTPVRDGRYFWRGPETAPERVLRWAIDFKSRREEMDETEEEEVVESLVRRGISPSASLWIELENENEDTFLWLRRLRAAYRWRKVRIAFRVRWMLVRWHEDRCAARYNLTKDDMEEEVADFNAAVAAVLAPQA